MKLPREHIEAAAKAVAWLDLTPLGRKQCDWHKSFSPAERAKYRCQAKAALAAVEINPRSRRVLAKALERERKRADKLQVKLADAFPKERRYDRMGEIRTLVRAEGRRIVRRTGCAIANFNMSDKEWDALATKPFLQDGKPII